MQQSFGTDDAVHLRNLEVELATTRIALKKAKKNFFLRWNCKQLHQLEESYEQAIAELRKNKTREEFLW